MDQQYPNDDIAQLPYDDRDLPEITTGYEDFLALCIEQGWLHDLVAAA